MTVTGAVLGSCYASLGFFFFKFSFLLSTFCLWLIVFLFCFVLCFKQLWGTKLFQTKPGKWFPMGIFVFCLNLLTRNTGSRSLLVQYFFRSAEKFVEGSYQHLSAFINKSKISQTHNIFLNAWTPVGEGKTTEACHTQTDWFWLVLTCCWKCI